MPTVDYAAAWMELIRFVDTKPHHGSRDLHAEMARIAADHEVSEDLLQRALRLHGGSLTLRTVPEPGADDEGRSPASAMPPDPGPSTDQRSHDEREHDQAEPAGSRG